MTVIPRSQRTNLPPGGSELPSPSLTRVNIAGTAAKGAREVGRTLAEIGELAQRANDEAELNTETINVQTKISNELARIKQNVQDPDQYNIEAVKAVNKIVKGSGSRVGFRNRKKFDIITREIELNANTTVKKEYFGKVVDKSKASHTLLKDTVVQGIAKNEITQDEGIAIVGANTNKLVANGIFDQEDKVAEDRGFAGRVAEVAFESKFPSDPTGAIKELNENKNISIEVKQNLIDKEVRKFNLVEKRRKEARRLDRIARVKDFRMKARRGEITEDDVVEDARLHPDNPMSVDETFAIINEINKVQKAGGIGNVTAFNNIVREVRRNPDLFSINDIYDYEDANDLNIEQSEKLEETWTKLTTGTSDPNDITTFREYKDAIDFTNLFAPSRFDVGEQLGVKKLRYDQAYGFAERKARELYKTDKDIKSVMSQVEYETLQHMEDYDNLVQRYIDEGILDTEETSIFEVKRVVEPVLKEKQQRREFSRELKGKISPTVTAPPEGLIRTDAQLDEIEVIMDRADAEGRDLTEDEIAEINRIQEIQ